MISSLLSTLADHALLVCVGLLAAATLAWPARALLRRDPDTCYQLMLALLVGAVAVLPLQLMVQGRAAPLAGPAREWLRSLARPPVIERPLREVPVESFLVEAPSTSRAFAAPAASPAASPEESTPGIASPRFARDGGAIAAAPVRPPSEVGSAAALPFGRASFARAAAFARRVAWERVAAGGWLLGVGLIALRRLVRAARTRRLVRRARSVDDPAILALWRRVSRHSRIAGRVRLVESTEVASPACAGLLKRVVILPPPPSAGRFEPLAPEILEWALRHELVHLERGDPWAALFQSAVTALLWFHPAAWWLSGEIGRLRELSCDQKVVEASGRRKSYALALLEYAASASTRIAAIDADPHSAGVRCALLHWSRSPSQIRRRIEMLTVDSASLPRPRKLLGALLAGCALAVPAIAQVAGAATLLPARQTPPPALQAPPSPLAPVVAPQVSTSPVPAPTVVAPRRKLPPTDVAPAPSVPVAATLVPFIRSIAPVQPLPQDTTDEPAPAAKKRRRVVVPTAVGASTTSDEPVAAATPTIDQLGYVGDVAEEADEADCWAAADDEGDADSYDGGDDDRADRIAATVQRQMRDARRQIEQALAQARRGQTMRQNGLKHELDQAAGQVDRIRAQTERKRESLLARMQDADDDERRAMLKSQLADLEASAELQSKECDQRCEDLGKELEKLAEVDFSDCAQSIAELTDVEESNSEALGEKIRQAVAAAAQVGAAGYTGDDGRVGMSKAEIERLIKQTRAVTERAQERASVALARAQESGALNAATRRQVEQALARVRQVDSEQVKQAVERAMRTTAKGMKAKRDAEIAATGATVRSGPSATSPRAPTGAGRARSGARAGSGRAGEVPSDPAVAQPGEGHERDLIEKISALERQIVELQRELESMRANAPTPAATGKRRALR